MRLEHPARSALCVVVLFCVFCDSICGLPLGADARHEDVVLKMRSGRPGRPRFLERKDAGKMPAVPIGKMHVPKMSGCAGVSVIAFSPYRLLAFSLIR